MSKDPGRPYRCKTTTNGRQCNNDVLPGTSHCEKHTRAHPLRRYLIDNLQVQAASDRHNAAESIHSLREELALTRAMIELQFNTCNDDYELLAATPRIQSLLGSAEHLANSCFKLDEHLGNLLDKTKLLEIAQGIINTIDTELKDHPDHDAIVGRIGTQIMSLIEESNHV